MSVTMRITCDRCGITSTATETLTSTFGECLSVGGFFKEKTEGKLFCRVCTGKLDEIKKKVRAEYQDRVHDLFWGKKEA